MIYLKIKGQEVERDVLFYRPPAQSPGRRGTSCSQYRLYDSLMAKLKGVVVDDLNLILMRTSIRHFDKNKKIKRDMLKILVQAGMCAPSAMNIQPWEFIVVSERNLLNLLAETLPNASMLREAGAAIVVCGRPGKDDRGVAEKFWVQDCSAATENILLAAEAVGLGAVWTGLYPDEGRLGQVRSMLSIPEEIIPLNVIPIGYAIEKTLPKDKWDEEKLHWEKWSS